MKKEEIPSLKNKVLEIIPCLQSEIWKTLEISTRDGSRLLALMVDEKLITRTKSGGTYMIQKNHNGNGSKPTTPEKKKDKYSVLLSSTERFSPCCGCTLDCTPISCKLLDSWIADL